MVKSETSDHEIIDRLILVTGLSGSGKTVALHALEDLGFYCIDNLPVGLINNVINHIAKQGIYRQIAVGTDARNQEHDIQQLPDQLVQLKNSFLGCDIFYFQADTETLLKRFSETRRKHPLTNHNLSLIQAIEEEKKLLEAIASSADWFVDTSNLNIHQLRKLLIKRVKASTSGMSLMLESFAYKHGVPPDIDIAFDVRCLPNPHWEKSLKNYTGMDLPIKEYLENHDITKQLFNDIQRFLVRWIPHYEAEDRSYVTIGIGCTGGKHRSVYMVEKLADFFAKQRNNVLTYHREIR